MKNLIHLIGLVLFLSCSTNQTKDQTNSKAVAPKILLSLDWLLGSWERKNEEAGKKTFEHWTKKSSEEYLGLGYTLQEQDTVFKEELSIIKINKIWTYKVIGVNEDPTLFSFTAQTTNSFICENKQNEFPKKIEYLISGNQMKANVSNEEMTIPFIFEKIIKK